MFFYIFLKLKVIKMRKFSVISTIASPFLLIKCSNGHDSTNNSPSSTSSGQMSEKQMGP